MKTICTFFSVMMILVAASNSHAVTVVIEDFNSLDQSISDLTTGDGAVTDTNALRTLSVELLATTAPTQQTTIVSFGVLDVTNGTGEDSEVMVSWNILPNLIPLNILNAVFSVEIVESDGNPTSLNLMLGATDLGTFQVPGNTSNQTLGFAIDPVLFNQGGLLKLTINGDPGWDMTIDAIGIEFREDTAVPEPMSMGLTMIGLGALGIRRRRATMA